MDGLAGLEAKAAAAQWQVQHGLTADGIAAVNTRAAITEESADQDGDWCDIRRTPTFPA